MKHFLRDKLNTIRVPRHIQELSYRINMFTNSLTYEQLNDLTNDDVAEALKVTTNAVKDAMQVDRRKSTMSLEDIFSDADSLSYEEVLSASDDYKEARENEDDKIVLKDVIEKLPDEYKELVKMYYYDDMSQKDIAEKLNMTQMRISRKMKKAFSMLYKMIADN